ncbi:patatin-like phospholipase family protein [Priestia flexa]|uniref:patatin-like phospholipase family protein n=1 Tax=Priestia flexa TaxID=86664 RepID=UPI0009713AD5|nr:patatin family protein [Priestia flexa]MBY6086254.1 patatin family protein [Priestia flexa]
MMINTGLVLEGGGMRGLYTTGVLDYFMEQDLYLPYVIGVSAGACHATSYLSRQVGRSRRANIDYIDDPRYLSLRNYFKTREMFGMDFVFEEIPTSLLPFDFDSFHKRTEQLVVGTTDCVTGKPVYFDNHEDDLLTIIRASSSLPFVSKVVEYGGKQLLDGGISDPIPVKKAESDGFKKNIVVLTRNKGYQKKKSSSSWFTKRYYRKYPGLVKALENRYKLYNDTLAYIDEQEEAGNIFVIRPQKPLVVGRMEKDRSKLDVLYKQGYEEAAEQYDKLKEWLKDFS